MKNNSSRVLIFLMFVILHSVGVAQSQEVVWDLVQTYNMQASNAKPAVDAALADAKNYLNSNPSKTLVLYFPAGEWTFEHPTSNGIYINTVTSGQLILRGAGTNLTKFVFKQFDQYGIYIRSSKNITIEKIHFSRHIKYTSQGHMLSFDGTVLRYKLHDGFLDPVWLGNNGNSLNHERVIVPFDGDPLDPISSAASGKISFADVVDRGNNEYDFTITSNAAKIRASALAVNQRLAIKCKVGTSMIFALGSDYLTFQDLLITNSSRDGIWVRSGDYLTARRVEISRGEPINGELAFFSQPADGIHFWAKPTTSSYIGGNMLVQDCIIEGTADDAIAVIKTDGAFTGYSENVIIERNKVRMGLARSIIANQTDGLIIRDNELTSQSDASMLLGDIINGKVYNNVFIDNRTGNAIDLEGSTQVLSEGIIDNVEIYDNEFREVNQDVHLITMTRVSNVSVSNNVITSFSSVPGNKGSNLINPAPLTYVRTNSSNVTGTSYYLTPTSKALVGKDAGSTNITTAWIQKIPVTGVSVSPSTQTLNPGGTVVLTATVSPSTASDKTVNFTSSNTSVATVNSSTGLVTAVASGTATITATTTDGGFKDTSVITVNNTVTEGVTLITGPSTVAAGEKVNIEVTYSASQQRDILVYFQELGTFTGYGAARTTVNAGSGTISIELTIDSNTPIAANNYRYTSFITTVGGAWAERVGGDGTALNTISVQSTLGANSLNKDKWNIYPNPAKDYVDISFSKASEGNVTFKLYNMLGQVVLQEKATENKENYRLNLNGVSQGLHVLEITTKNEVIQRKIEIK